MDKDPKEYGLSMKYSLDGEAFETEDDANTSSENGGYFSDDGSSEQNEEKELSPEKDEELEAIEQEVETLMQQLLKGIEISHLAGVTEEKAIELLESGQIEAPDQDAVAEGFEPDRGELQDLPSMGGDPKHA